MGWREAWAESDHLGGTLSAAEYARNAVAAGGWRAVALPAAVCVALALAFVVGAFAAAVLAGEADSIEGRGFFLILASVGLSQVLTLLQNQHPAKRMFVAAEARARNPPTAGGSSVFECRRR
jgi:ABC-type arginine transport system permease subunit